MGYIADKPRRGAESAAELRSRIPGWGVDLDRAQRPGARKEHFIGARTGAHWEFPELQPERMPRERTVEHESLTPVFGTSCPTRGLSGMVRRRAYKLSERRISHWLLLAGADRIDVLEGRIEGLLRGEPDDLIAESGVRAELKHNGLRARDGKRADRLHQPLDAIARGTAVMAWTPFYALGMLMRPLTSSLARAR